MRQVRHLACGLAIFFARASTDSAVSSAELRSRRSDAIKGCEELRAGFREAERAEEDEAGGEGGAVVEPIELAVTAMLFGTVSFGMSLFYLVNHSDADIKRHSWQVISSTIAIFVAVLVYQGIHGIAAELINEFIRPHVLPQTADIILCLLKYVEACVWFGSMHTVIHAQASGLIVHGHEDFLSDKEQRLVCYSTLLSHMSAFACISGGATMQRLDMFASSWYMTLVPSLITASFLFVLFRLSDWIRSLIEAYEHDTDEVCALWGEHSEDGENEIGGFCLSFLIVQALVYLAVGSPVAAEEAEGRVEVKPPSATILLLLFAMGFICITVAMVFLTGYILAMFGSKRDSLKVGSQKGLDPMSDYLTRWIYICQQVFAMCIAWCLLHASEWEVHRFLSSHMRGGGSMLEPQSTSQHVFLALTVSFVSFVGIFALDYLQDLPVTGEAADNAIGKVIKAIAILVGFSWEEAFRAGVEAFSRLTGSSWREAISKLVLGVIVALMVVPAWRWYILKTVLRIEESYKRETCSPAQPHGGEHGPTVPAVHELAAHDLKRETTPRHTTKRTIITPRNAEGYTGLMIESREF